MTTLQRGCVLLLSVLALGCSTMTHATQVGGKDPATWVYVKQTGFGHTPGIYRCKEKEGRVTCKRARMK